LVELASVLKRLSKRKVKAQQEEGEEEESVRNEENNFKIKDIPKVTKIRRFRVKCVCQIQKKKKK
jgi:hypothetical protein